MENRNIALIGMSGCGKTTIGKLLAEKLKLLFYDVDLYIEKGQEKSIKDIFLNGEEYFRKIESLALEEIVNKGGYKVIATGGGVVKDPKNMEHFGEDFIIVFLNRNIEAIAEDIDVSNRPLLSEDLSKIYMIYEQRLPLYKKYCDFEIKYKESIKETIDEILHILS
ncbi:shikimate kinase [Clostridium sp. CS001]|uniref:shikimate kinase n=1 Tax=Clostridium sp. CS001 TaxID=2880648 RepID=UPI001CF2C204|nr:shikimate kinase [Clostridium sp. CS001]MCB2291096.1 shikimate kinase [Clostridium sp. CS001]